MFKKLLLVVTIISTSEIVSAQELTEFAGIVKPVSSKHYRGSPENGFPVTQIHVKEGDWVNQGDVLIELDPADLPLNLKKAQVEVANGDLAMLLSKREIRGKVLARCKLLREKKAISVEELDLAQECVNCLDAEIERAKAAIKVAKVAYEQADFVHTNYEVMKSPIAGEVVRVNCALGQCGRAETGPVVWIDIIDSREIEIHFPVPTKTAKSLKKGHPVLISQDGQTWKSEVTTVTKLADSNRQIPIIVKMSNPDKLICETEVRVSIK